MVSSKPANQARAEVLFRAAEILEDMGDMRGAFRCLLAGAKLNHDSSQLNLGNMYAAGLGTKRDLKQAAYWYKTAYRKGDATGAFNLGIDKRRQGDVRSAIIWFKKAIARGHGGACIALAEIFAQRPASRKKAIILLQKALQMNSDNISEAEREQATSALQKLSAASAQTHPGG